MLYVKEVYLSVWIVVVVCILTIAFSYIKNVGILILRKQYVRLTILSISVIALCLLLITMANYLQKNKAQ